MNPNPAPFPGIRTPRLLLREFVASDLPALRALLACPRVMEFSPSGPLSDDQDEVHYSK